MRCEGLRFEFGMELDGDVPRMRWQLDDLDELAIERTPDDLQPLVGQRFFKEAIEFVPVAMTFVDDLLSVQLMGAGSGFEFARVRAQPHSAAEVIDAEQI